jgi:DNA-binding transcriptional ArsR family regulator
MHDTQAAADPYSAASAAEAFHSPSPDHYFRDDTYARGKSSSPTTTLEPGTRLRNAEITVALGVSRTRVGEAMRRLRDEGLIDAEQADAIRYV